MNIKKNAVVSTLLSLVLIPFLSNLVFVSPSSSKEMPAACQTSCVSPYGKVLGATTDGVEGYSNCNSSCVIFEPNKWKGTYTGIKWQCVEYARRWLLVHKGAVYGDVDIAADIWNKIDHLTHIASKKDIPLESHLNGSKQAPQIGDMLIYAKAFYGTGHVAIVTDVDLKNGYLKVGEQNFNNELWPGDYARKIELIEKDGRYWLLDGYILGWKRISTDL